MTEAILEAVTQWGMAGIAIFAAGYVIWNTHKEERKNKERYEEKLLELQSKKSTRESAADTNEAIKRLEKHTSQSISELGQKIDDLTCNQDMCKTKLVEMDNKINALDQTVSDIRNRETHSATQRYTNIIRVAPTINTILVNNMQEMHVDHIFVALLHNGTQGITGIPFIKQSVIAEKYDPIQNTNDFNYTVEFKDDELTKHDKLPAAILQNEFVDIIVDDNGHSKMDELDILSARQMVKIGTKRIMFKAIKDERGVPMGYICAYSYLTRDVDLELFKETAETIERVYRDVCA